MDFKTMLSHLQAMNTHTCKECGMMFGTSQNLEFHKHQHFKQRLMKVEGRECGESRTLCLQTEKRWSGEMEGGISNDKFTISETQWSQEEALCILCNRTLTM